MIFCNSSLSILFFAYLFLSFAIIGHGKNSNMCNWIKCTNGGTCQNIINSTIGYHCRCPFGFTGVLCEDRISITSCSKNPCLNNGNCTMRSDRFIKCRCLEQYTGLRCEILK